MIKEYLRLLGALAVVFIGGSLLYAQTISSDRGTRFNADGSSVSVTNAINVNGSTVAVTNTPSVNIDGETVTVSNTVTVGTHAVTQSGSWTATITNAPLTNFTFDNSILKTTNIGGISLSTNGLAQDSHQITQTELLTRLSNVMTSAGIKLNSNIATEATAATLDTASAALEQRNRLSNTVERMHTTLTTFSGQNSNRLATLATETTLGTLQTASAALEQANRLSNTVKSTLTVQGAVGTNSAIATDFLPVLAAYATNGAMANTEGRRTVLRVYPDGGLVVCSTNVVAISAASLPLPSGAATEATLSVFSSQTSNRLAAGINVSNLNLNGTALITTNLGGISLTTNGLAQDSHQITQTELLTRLSNSVSTVNTTLSTFSGQNSNRLSTLATEATLSTFSGQNSNRLATLSTEATLSTFSSQNSNRLATLDTATAALEQNNRLSNMLVRLETILQYQTNAHNIASGVTASGTQFSNVVKSSGGRVFGAFIGWTNAQPGYAKFWNTNTAHILSATPPIATFILPGNTNGAGNNIILPVRGFAMTNGIYFGITGGPATNDSTTLSGIYPWAVVYE